MNVENAAAAVGRLAARAAEIEQALNQADGKLGDGDTGTTLRRVFEKMAEAPADGGDLGAYFMQLARAAMATTGSSLGTLVAVALMTLSKGMVGAETLAPGDLADRLAEARDAMIARGGAKLGDKTVLDSLDAAVEALRAETDPTRLAASASTAAQTALDAFRGQPCRIGRARMFGEKSVGVDDPGMLAFARLVEVL